MLKTLGSNKQNNSALNSISISRYETQTQKRHKDSLTNIPM